MYEGVYALLPFSAFSLHREKYYGHAVMSRGTTLIVCNSCDSNL